MTDAVTSPLNRTDQPIPRSLDAVSVEWLREHRALSLIEGYADSSGTVRVWFITAEQASQIADLLGEADSTSFVPPGSMREFAVISEGLPTHER